MGNATYRVKYLVSNKRHPVFCQKQITKYPFCTSAAPPVLQVLSRDSNHVRLVSNHWFSAVFDCAYSGIFFGCGCPVVAVCCRMATCCMVESDGRVCLAKGTCSGNSCGFNIYTVMPSGYAPKRAVNGSVRIFLQLRYTISGF